MSLTNFWKEKVWEKLSFTDYILIKLSCIAFGLILIAWIPALNKIEGWWYFIAFLLLAIKPLYTVFKK